MPVDIIKIDRSFTIDSRDGNGNALLEAIVAMARHLGLEIIPEGIEDIDQRTRLRSMGCNMGQGFLLSRRSPPENIEALLAWPLPDLRLFAETVGAQRPTVPPLLCRHERIVIGLAATLCCGVEFATGRGIRRERVRSAAGRGEHHLQCPGVR